ncbi:MAG: cytochrome c [Myxococcota bacterium]
MFPFRCRALLGCVLVCMACGGDEPPAPTPPPSPDIGAILARQQVPWEAAERTQAIATGREALVRHECNRCHTIDDIEPAGRADHCTSCHQWIKGLTPGHRHYEMLSTRYGEDTLLRYQRNIEHFQQVPNLTGVAKRLSPRWIHEFIGDPYDLRPAMDENMVRTHMSDADRLAIARYFAAVAQVADPAGEAPSVPEARPSAERVERGKQLFLTRGCTTCHTFGNLETGRTAADLQAAGFAAQLAPNLRFARDRMSREVMVAWIEEPSLLAEGTLMPDMQLTHDEANAVTDFLRHAEPPLGATPSVRSVEPPAAVERPVGWAEVKERLLGRICVHCHMNDHERDRGPGNEGGFGWPGNRLAMRTYETLVYGAVDPESGERYSVLQPREGHTHPPVVEVMMTRRNEERRDRVEPFHDSPRPAHVNEEPGMPMGLPSIPDDEVALLRAWIAQGCPGPTEVTGMPGITDGFLVPDGPIAKNEGCEVRAPSEDRPSWSTRPPPEWARPEPSTPMEATARPSTSPTEM